MKPFDKFLLAVVRYGLFAVFALPFVVWLGHLYPWVTGKVLSFEIIVELLFPLYVLLALRRREFRPSKNAFMWILLGYFAIITLSGLLGSNPHRSFWSKPDRLTGLFFQYHLLAFFLMAGSVWRKVMAKPIVATVGVAVVLSLHALYQVFFHGSGADSRGSASLGNPDYLGQYLVPHLFLALWLLHRNWTTKWRWPIIGASVLIFAGIVSAQSKGALVGVFIGILTASLLLAFREQGKLRRVGQIGLALLVLAVVGYFAGNKIGPVNRWMYDHRFDLQYLQETTGSRKLLLANAVKGIGQRPVLGWGPENFEDGFYLNYDPSTLKYSDYETRQDRPHNLALELLHNIGIIGLLAYIALIVFAFRLALKKGTDRLAGGTLIVAAVGQIGTNLFIFETPASYVALFLVFSLIAAHASENEAVEPGPDETSMSAIPFFIVTAALSIWCLAYVLVGTIRAASITAKMIMGLGDQASAQDWSDGLKELRAQKTPYYERDIRALVSHISTPRGQYLTSDFKPILVDMAEDEYRHLKKDRYDYVQALVTASSYLSFQPRTAEQQAALEESSALASKQSPNRQEVEEILEQIAVEKGDKAEAEKHAARYRDLSKGLPLSVGWWVRWKLESGDAAAGVDYLADHREAIGDKTAWSQVEYGTLHLLSNKRWQDLVDLQQASVKRDIRNVQWDLTGAIALYALGQKDKSDKLLEDSGKLFPEKKTLIDQIAATRERLISGQGT